jgi:hypothetical protein
MALARFQSTAVDTSGNVIPGASVTVRSQNTGNLVSIFSDRAGEVALSNPFTADSNGYFGFHVAGGTYRIAVSDGTNSAEFTWVGVGRVQENEIVRAIDFAVGINQNPNKTIFDYVPDLTASDVQAVSWASAPEGAVLYLNKAWGGGESGNYGAIPVAGSGLGSLFFGGADGSAFQAAAYISCTNNVGVSPGSVSGNLTFHTNPVFGTFPDERMRITSAGNVGIGTSSPGAPLDVVGTGYTFNVSSSGTSNAIAGINSSNNSFAQTALFVNTARAASTAFNYFVCAEGNFTEDVYRLRGDGNAFADGAWTGGGADYAEYFEWSDGNPDEDDRRGYSVVLDGEKVRPATSDDASSAIIGVVSTNPAVVGDSAWNHWSGKYLRDDFGSHVMEDYEVWEWTEVIIKPASGHCPEKTEDKPHSYAFDGVPEGVIVPEDKTITIQQRKKLNPDYDPDEEYISREDRPEWVTIGLMGKLRLRKGQPTGDRWIKMRDISADVEEWLVR